MGRFPSPHGLAPSAVFLLAAYATLPPMPARAQDAFATVDLPGVDSTRCPSGRVCAPKRGFSTELVAACKRIGGGSPCEKESYSVAAYHASLSACAATYGLELCLGQPCGEAGQAVCSVDLAPFPDALAEACRAVGGDPTVCAKSQIPKALFRKALAACREGAGGSADKCLSRTSRVPQPRGLVEVARFKPEWKAHAREFLLSNHGAPLLAHDTDALDPASPAPCPRYASLDDSVRAEYWSGIAAAMVRWESDFDPRTRNESDPGGGSWGLLQISPLVKERLDLEACPVLRRGEDLFAPATNLTCGLELLGRQIAARGRVFLTTKERFYWRVLEVYGPGAIRPAVAEGFTRATMALLPCHVPPPDAP